jgi:hypothetical protein
MVVNMYGEKCRNVIHLPAGRAAAMPVPASGLSASHLLYNVFLEVAPGGKESRPADTCLDMATKVF